MRIFIQDDNSISEKKFDTNHLLSSHLKTEYLEELLKDIQYIEKDLKAVIAERKKEESL